MLRKTFSKLHLTNKTQIASLVYILLLCITNYLFDNSATTFCIFGITRREFLFWVFKHECSQSCHHETRRNVSCSQVHVRCHQNCNELFCEQNPRKLSVSWFLSVLELFYLILHSIVTLTPTLVPTLILTLTLKLPE